MSLKKHFIFKQFVLRECGSVLGLVALMLPLLLMVAGVTIDLGRLYAVKSRAQGALDAALLSAVATASSGSIAHETRELFDANFTPGYMGASVASFSTGEDDGIYTAITTLRVPMAIMQMFGFSPVSITVSAKVTNSPEGGTLELAIAIDNSAGVNVAAIREASKAFANYFYGAESSLSSVYVSVVPFNVAVNVGLFPLSRWTWPQELVQFLLYSDGTNAYLANRNGDIPVTSPLPRDVDDASPAIPFNRRFRTPYGFAPGFFNNGDGITTNLARLRFGLTSKADVISAFNAMRAGGATRLNVGMMWSWFTLSPRWQGRWDASKPGLPLTQRGRSSKYVVMVAGSQNNVYLGGMQPCGGMCAVSNDNATFQDLCTAMKAQGIKIYTVGFGSPGNYNAGQLTSCSSGNGYHFNALDEGELVLVYQTISDSLKYSSLRLIY